jgi:hypothetical protein
MATSTTSRDLQSWKASLMMKSEELKVKKKQKLLLPSLLGVILQYTTTKDWFAFDFASTIPNLLPRCSGQLGIRSNQFARSKATVLDSISC